jgi:polyferredoxin
MRAALTPCERTPLAPGRHKFRSITARVEWAVTQNLHRVPVLQATMAAVFVLLVLAPAFLPDPPDNAGPFDHPVPFARAVLWEIWFPATLLSVLFAGRSWCGFLCPMGAASEAASRIGLRRGVPSWLQWAGTPIAAFLVVTVLGQTLGIRDHPEATAEIFGATMTLAILVGFLYGPGKRPWCRHACPIGLLLGVYSRLGIVQFIAKRPLPGGDAIAAKGVCPTMIDLRRKRESRHCLTCFRCVSPAAAGGLSLHLRRPGAEIEEIRTHSPHAAEVWFLYLGGGLALGGFLWTVLPEFTLLRAWLVEQAIDREWLWLGTPGPAWLMSVHPARREVFVWLDFFAISGFMVATMLAVALMLTLAAAATNALAGRFGADSELAGCSLEIGYQVAPVVLVSLLLGLGGGAFVALSRLGIGPDMLTSAKAALLVAGAVWSLRLGDRILVHQGLAGGARAIALVPSLAANAALALAWAPALF